MIRLSIIIPTFKRPELLSRTLGSIVRQNIRGGIVEVIVVDDEGHSASSVVESFKCYVKESLDINYLPRLDNEPSGVSSARNKGIEFSKGGWLLFIDDDDFLAEGSISAIIEAIKTGGYDFLIGSYRIVEEDNRGKVSGKKDIVLNSYSDRHLLVQNYIPIGAFVIKKEKVTCHFEERIKSHEDWLFLLDNLVGPEIDIKVGYIESIILNVSKSAGQARVQRNNAQSLLAVGHDYLRIYSMYPNESLVRARLSILSQLGCPSIETMIGSSHPQPGFTIPTSQGRFFISNTSETIQKSLIEKGGFEELASKLAIAWCQGESGAVIDVGANQGIFTIPVAKSLPGSDVIAIEPQSMVFMQLCTNVVINGLSNVSVKNCAVGVKDKRHELLVPKFDIYKENYTGSVSLDDETIAIRKAIPGIEEPSLRAVDYEKVGVSELADLWPTGRVLFIKVDVEGMEQEVIESGIRNIVAETPAIFFESWGLEQFSDKSQRILKIIDKIGYIVVGFGDDKLAFHRNSVVNDAVKNLVRNYGQHIPDELSLMPSWFYRFELPLVLKDKLVEKAKVLSIAIFIVENNVGSFRSSISSAEALMDAGINVEIFIVDDFCVYRSNSTEDREPICELDSSGYFGAVRHVCNLSYFDWFLFLEAGDGFFEDPSIYFLNELCLAPKSCFAIYSDLILDHQFLGRSMFNIDGFLSNPSLNLSYYFFRSSLLTEFKTPSELIKDNFTTWLSLKILEEKGINAFGHVDVPMIYSSTKYWRLPDSEQKSLLVEHLRKRGYEKSSVISGSVPGTYSLSYANGTKPSVSIIVPTKDKLSLLRTCIESILERTAYPNYEIIIVDNDSRTPEAVAWLNGLERMGLSNVRVLRYRKDFNFSAINNYAVSKANGEYVLLLNNDTAVIHSDWLEQLVNHAIRPEVGIVGSKLLFPDGTIQHAGVVLGMRGPAEHVSIGVSNSDPGYMNRLVVDQNYSAVTAACMLVRRSVYQQVGGLDEEAFVVSFNDIDLCLKVAEAGYLTVWAPRSLVMHVANASQTSVDRSTDEQKVARFKREQEMMYERWLPYIGNDPAFNRNLSLRANGFEVEQRVELNWQPQKLLNLPTILVYPADLWGCGHYRIVQPLEGMKSEGIAGGMIAKEWLTVPEMARLEPDAFVYQRQITPEAVESMKYARRFLKKPIVYELDDFLPNLPIKSAYRKNMPRDIMKSLRASLKHVDRFVVSTHPLAEAFKGAHPDIRVVENRLPLDWWADLTSTRRFSEKPRIGWAGGIGHTGDLELVEAVVRDLADEVDWVFFGMCPDRLRPHVKEVHDGVDIELYPRKLASMNLDLAIAPLEDNLFNRCKSNLRLLEYGACGFPVVCSDVVPYREHDLPVTRVKNRYKDWVDAVRMHITDLDETARVGDELRAVVRRDWMLEGENLQQWLDAWTEF